MKRSVIVLVMLLSLMFAFGAQAEVKNVVVMISDGWSYNLVRATEYYTGNAPAYLGDDWTELGMSTYMWYEDLNDTWYYKDADCWSDFNWQMTRYTDSAAAATAMSTGCKSYGGSIGVDPMGQALTHSIDYAEALGKATGVVSSVEFSHATPAAFVAHNASRNNYAEIAVEMLEESACEVIMGCGHPFYDDNGVYRDQPSSSNYNYIGGEAEWDLIANGTAGGDYPWTLVEDKQAFIDLATGETPDRVLGIPQVYKTLQYNRANNPGGNSTEPPYAVPFIETVPSLQQMVAGALNVLDNDEDGFFLMIEGGAVDWAGHGNVLGRMIEEEVDFDNAFQTVMDWVNANSSWDETLLIVTGDHETGNMWGPNSGSPAIFNPIVDNGVGNMPEFHYYSGNHTNMLINFYVKGACADIFTAFADEHDMVRGNYIDNVEIGQAVINLWNGSPAMIVTPEKQDLFVNAPGSFRYDLDIFNGTGMDYVTDLWIDVELPNGAMIEGIREIHDIVIAADACINLNPVQLLPGNAPIGEYTYYVRMGEMGFDVVNESVFNFTVLTTAAQQAGEWTVTGFDAPETAIATASMPNEFAITSVYPNPFNPTTTIDIRLPEAADLNVAVFNVMGQQVAELANDRFAAGSFNLSFDGSDLSSGVYFIRALVPGQMNETVKVMLMK